MDTRKYKQSTNIAIPKQFQDDILDSNDQILPVNQIANDSQYLDATIYNLCEKIAIGNQLQEMYYNHQQKSMAQYGIPKQLKYYIHSEFILPIFGVTLFVMKARRTLTMQKACILTCGLSMANEFFKYKKSKSLNEKLAISYDEHNAAYSDLMNNLTGVLTYKDVLRQLFDIDLSKEQLQSLSHYDEERVEDFSMSLY